ncbi:glucose 1-dehydrogenase [Isoptericola sp. b441]|uniref:Glucose 1-dehydrogenase n=1 Tax=Actinotalea lenta TaxID=3064654 RepID=A0ABT9D6Q2_9CELL|nr:glucose 1-dehydrogenase [Isoptericola sp. b441]MDO8106520.1 glucose 1-dehydrogenase [Isoptericola sp. b441]
MFDLTNKVAAVTGASRGIGKAIALGLAEAGADVVLLGPDADGMRGVADQVRDRGRRALVVELDIRDVPAIEPAFAYAARELGPVQILVNNAGVNRTEPAVEVSQETWDRLFDVNLRGAFFCSTAAAKGMLDQGAGKIINIASDAGAKGYAEHAVYGATKGGLIQLTRDLAVEWGPSNIQVNAVAPGATWTDMTTPAMQDPATAASILARGVSTRITNPEEIAAAVVYLASREADQVMGHVLAVDGGSGAQ